MGFVWESSSGRGVWRGLQRCPASLGLVLRHPPAHAGVCVLPAAWRRRLGVLYLCCHSSVCVLNTPRPQRDRDERTHTGALRTGCFITGTKFILYGFRVVEFPEDKREFNITLTTVGVCFNLNSLICSILQGEGNTCLGHKCHDDWTWVSLT